MLNRYSRGSTARFYFDIVAAGVGITGLSPRIALERKSDGSFFQASDDTWQPTLVENAMTETNSVRLPGRYHFDFDQSLDELTGSTEYTVKKVSDAGTLALEYETAIFEPLAATASPGLCSVQGTLLTGQGEPLVAELVRATLVPIYKDDVGRGYQSDTVYMTFTDQNGDFQLPLVQGGVFRLEIQAIGFDRRLTIPAQATALFTDI